MTTILKTALIASAVALAGCTSPGCKSNQPGPVHPTDEQIHSAPGGEVAKDPPYVPWWAEK